MKIKKLRNSNKTTEIQPHVPAHAWREPTQRILHIHELIAGGKYPNATSLADDLGTSPRTVHRDLDYMRDKFHLPIEYDPEKLGFKYSEPVAHPPGMAELSEREIFCLLVADKAVAEYAGTPFGPKLQDIFRRFTSYLGADKRYSAEGLGAALSVRPFGADDTDLDAMRMLDQAITQQQMVFFEYRKLGESLIEEREVQPYHLYCTDHRWYLVAYDVDRSDYRTFVLNRMGKVEVMNRRFQRDKNFSVAEYFKKSLKVMRGDGDYVVIVDFDARATDLMRGRHYHPSQRTLELPGGRSRVTMQLSSLEEVRPWVLQWEEHANVVGPEALRRSLGRIGSKLADQYSTAVPVRLAA